MEITTTYDTPLLTALEQLAPHDHLQHGSFGPEWMSTFWRDATAEAMDRGFSALRAGETEWLLCDARDHVERPPPDRYDGARGVAAREGCRLMP